MLRKNAAERIALYQTQLDLLLSQKPEYQREELNLLKDARNRLDLFTDRLRSFFPSEEDQINVFYNNNLQAIEVRQENLASYEETLLNKFQKNLAFYYNIEHVRDLDNTSDASAFIQESYKNLAKYVTVLNESKNSSTYREAIEHFYKKNMAKIFYMTGCIQNKFGQIKAAEEAFKECLQWDTNHPSAKRILTDTVASLFGSSSSQAHTATSATLKDVPELIKTDATSHIMQPKRGT